ncbi:MAG: response regulator [Chthoniobacter sp.]|nr:response regulator [Chthoniobacter sp.]
MKAHVILLVSSDPVVTRTVEDAVLNARHGFRHIAERAEALRELSTGCDDIDLAIIDFDPGIQGLELFNAARSHLPVLVLTHRDVADMDRILQRHGASGCLTKPVTEADLAAAIRSLLVPKAVVV